MPISFSCHQCGKTFKAPDDATGQSSRCPGCGSPVTCLEPVYDAELVEAPSAVAQWLDASDPDPDGAGAMAMAAAPVEAEADPGVRKPCPMCGEMIVATAAKCRFCGEVFDETLKKTGPGGKDTRKTASARSHLMIGVALWIVSGAGLQALLRGKADEGDPRVRLVLLIVGAVNVAAYLGVALYVFVLARRLYNAWIGIVLALLTIIPLVNLVIVFQINQRVNRYLEENGYEVGLVGANVS